MTKAVVIGASGYGGAELARLLTRHPSVTLAGLFVQAGSNAAGKPFSALYPRFAGEIDEAVQVLDFAVPAKLDADVAFLALPHEASLELAPKLLAQGLIVIDLSGAYRLAAEDYPAHYGFAHTEPEALAKAQYGLPEFYAPAIAEANLIAAPGCYVTAATLALKPLVEAGLIAEGCAPIVHAVSGVSGAGKTPSAKTHVCEVSLEPYNVFAHRHQPEMRRYVGAPVLFTPVLGHYKRGILASCYATVKDGVTLEQINAAFENAYGDKPMVRFSATRMPSVGAVEYTSYCDIHAKFDAVTRQVAVFSALDNLLKGASSQAVQAMNVRLGLPQQTGLTEVCQ